MMCLGYLLINVGVSYAGFAGERNLILYLSKCLYPELVDALHSFLWRVGLRLSFLKRRGLLCSQQPFEFQDYFK